DREGAPRAATVRVHRPPRRRRRGGVQHLRRARPRGRARARPPPRAEAREGAAARSRRRGARLHGAARGRGAAREIPARRRLLRRLDRVPGLRRLRFVTSFPTLLTHDLMQAVHDCETVVSYVHLPVQSGSNACLKRMARGYTADSYLRLVERLRAVAPKVELA